MAEITRELLRKKAEHNEGMLSTLEEISLHQLDIQRISQLDTHCRHLKMIYFQNNLIEKMEGISKLKELEYINLAVNSVQLIEGVRGCECLQKLDLTLNFIDIEDFEESIDNLAELQDFRELYLLGNPCMDWKRAKEYIYARLPDLGRLDGEEISKTMKFTACQNLESMQKELCVLARKSVEKKVLEEKEGHYDPDAYNKDWRRNVYEEQKERDRESEQKRKDGSMFKDYNEMVEANKRDDSNVPIYNKDGSIRQANKGGYEWRFDETEDKTSIIFEIKVPKFMDTSKINVDLQPNYVRLDINERITQLTIPEFILVEKTKVQRSTTTGVLQLTMPKATITSIEARNMRIKAKHESRDAAKKLRDLDKQQELAKKEAEKAEIIKPKSKVEDYSNDKFIIREAETDEEKRVREEAKKKKFYEEFEPDFDIDEVPPLE